jgi:hypothetical protein
MAKFNPKFHRKKELRSTFEGTIEQQLEAAGVDYEYESDTIQWVRKITSGKCLGCGHSEVGQLCDYTPDFRITTKAGRVWYIEVKGYLDGPDRTKLRTVRKQHPGLDIRLVFQRDNVIKGTKNKTRYSEWAKKNGFVYSIGSVPKEWLKPPAESGAVGG